MFRNYVMDTRYGVDYCRLRKFFLDNGRAGFSFGRWDWMISHAYLDVEGLPRIGIWEKDGEIVGVVLYDTVLDGCCFFSLKDGFDYLYEEMIEYAEEHLAGPDGVMLAVRDENRRFQDAALRMGYRPTQYKDCTSVFEMDEKHLEFELPEGFVVTSMRDTFDPYQYGRILWNGFNHELDGDGPYLPSQEDLDGFRMGLGRAAVLEALRRCAALGAKHAYVGSSQQFYYNIGFKPSTSSTFWTK